MKRLMSTALCVIIFTVNVIFIPYFTPVYAAGDVASDVIKSIGFDTVVKFVKTIYSVGYNVATNGSGDGSAASKSLDNIWGEDSAINKWLQTELFPFMDINKNIDLTKENCPITYDKEKQLVEFNPTFTNKLSEQLQDRVHDMDGYWLITPSNTWDINKIISWKKSKGYTLPDETISSFKKIMGDCLVYWKNGPYSDDFLRFDISDLLYYEDNYIYLYPERGKYGSSIKCASLDRSSCVESTSTAYFYSSNGLDATIKYMLESFVEYSYGAQFKIFQSYDYLERYLNNGKQRIYVPKLPSGGLKVPITYIQNNVNLPDLNINLDSLIGKAEADIQADIDLALKNYFDKLLEINNNPSQPTNPTPTPSGGGSGDFGDGTTPTPKPDFGDGSDLTDTNDWLKKIYEWLQSFGDTHLKFEKTITDYIEANDGKLDQIIEAINALSGGKTEDEKNGCKYDFTALSDFMTKLWNESDKKFDKMVELLEENNKYQKKLVNSLNEIKAILVTQTIMDVFQDRSQQTAEKAKDKFPTSLPWDIALVVNAMSAEPEKPQFDLPIQIKSLNINEEIHVDLASGEWEKLAKTCRYLLSILFILLMIQLSRKLFSNGGDD